MHWLLRDIDSRLAIDAAAVEHLAGHVWPGNFRELRAVLTRALLRREAERRDQPLDRADIDAVLPRTPPGAPASRLQQGAADLVRSA